MTPTTPSPISQAAGEPQCTCAVRLMPGQIGATHSQDCPITAWVRAAFKASGESASGRSTAPTTGSAPDALGELAGWCFPSGGRTRFADQGDTVDLRLKDVMRPVYYAAPPANAPSAGAPFVVDQSDPMWAKHLYENMRAAHEVYENNPTPEQPANAPVVRMLTDEEILAVWRKFAETGLCSDVLGLSRALLAASMGGEKS